MAAQVWIIAACGLCAVAVAVALVAYRRGARAIEVAGKCVASSCFVAIWWLRDDAPSAWLLAALLGCFVGDVCLLGRSSRMFAAGLAAFLLAHLCYGAVLLINAPMELRVLGGSALLLAALGGATFAWLRPRVPARLQAAVAAYFVVLLGMCALAAGAVATTLQWPWLVGAFAFAASDLAVALHRFVNNAGVHRLWGLPLYYAAQLTLAWTMP